MTSQLISECPNLEAVVGSKDGTEIVLPALEHLSIHYSSSLKSIWEGVVPKGSFAAALRTLNLHACPELTYVLKSTMLESVSNLEELQFLRLPKFFHKTYNEPRMAGCKDKVETMVNQSLSAATGRYICLWILLKGNVNEIDDLVVANVNLLRRGFFVHAAADPFPLKLKKEQCHFHLILSLGKQLFDQLQGGVDCDVDLHSVESEEFWKGAEPLRSTESYCCAISINVFISYASAETWQES
ncbi:hypothetical protein COLO4_04266 [Corchorus olitorius]|uniref:Uncharacterized protein n=1 Tax=Corchorus olitorius TaxID=93759 RepID=A0A1R3KUS4_9ROSI|nr:hypothetical protein COLO4_04266 [Corchorus olitorius]